MDIRIVILQRGWVLVGDFKQVEDKMYSLTNSAVIRRWGTDQGLGELAFEGPKSGTILDKEPESKFHVSQIIRTIKCETPDLWIKAINK
jgi:hypothetical protein